MILNKEATNILKDVNWENVTIENLKGTTMILYHHKDIWMVSTRRCIDSNNSNGFMVYHIMICLWNQLKTNLH